MTTFRVNEEGGDVYTAAYIIIVNFMNPVVLGNGGATLFGTYGGGAGVLVPIGAAAFDGEILTSTPTDCNDGSTQSETFYLAFQSAEPVFINLQDNVIYYDNVVSSTHGVGFSHARRELLFLNPTQARAKGEFFI